MRRVSKTALSLIFGVVLLGACAAPAPVQGPRQASVLSELSLCDARVCWQGHSLSLLTPEQVQADVRQLPGYEEAEINKLWSEGDITLYGWNSVGERFVQLVMHNNTPIVFARALRDDVTLGEVVNRLGDPSHVLVRVYPNPELILVGVDMIFESQGLIFSATPAKGMGQYDVTSNLRGHSYTLTAPQDPGAMYAAALYPMYGPSKLDLAAVGNDLAKLMQPWRGYGRYEVKSP